MIRAIQIYNSAVLKMVAENATAVCAKTLKSNLEALRVFFSKLLKEKPKSYDFSDYDFSERINSADINYESKCKFAEAIVVHTHKNILE